MRTKNEYRNNEQTQSAEGAFLEPLTKLVTALQGHTTLEDGLAELAPPFGADAALLTRLNRSTEMRVLVARFPAHKNFGALCDELLLVNRDAVLPGHAIFASEYAGTDEAIGPKLKTLLDAGKLLDVVVVTLQAGQQYIDRLELHYATRPCELSAAQMQRLAQITTEFYQLRRPGVCAGTVLSQKRKGLGYFKAGSDPILGPTNPAGLTRSEFRVCHLVSCGLAAKGLSEELGVSRHTVRTHLRHIYDKTGAENFYELSHRLVSLEERSALSASHYKEA